MSDILENLKRKPESVRKKVLHSILIIFAIVLILIWGVILKFRFTSDDVSQGLKEDTKPFNNLTEDLSNNFPPKADQPKAENNQ